MNYFEQLVNGEYKGLVRILTSSGSQYRFSTEDANFSYSKEDKILSFETDDNERVALNQYMVESIITQK